LDYDEATYSALDPSDYGTKRLYHTPLPTKLTGGFGKHAQLSSSVVRKQPGRRTSTDNSDRRGRRYNEDEADSSCVSCSQQLVNKDSMIDQLVAINQILLNSLGRSRCASSFYFT
jgi:hypothetical protein